MATIPGKHALLEQLLADGTKHIFGNPGSTELAFMDGLQDYPQIQYMLGLHETVAVAMADGYARATGRPSFVNLHIAPGLANGMSMIYNAWKGGTPLVVSAGQQDTRFLLTEPLLSGDLVRLARPWTKWSGEVTRGDDIPMALRRAFKVAQEPPKGPVFVSFPQDVLDHPVSEPIVPTTHISWHIRPDQEAIERAATLLAGAEHPCFLVGDQMAYAGGQTEVAALAEMVGAPIYAGSNREWNFPTNHPLYMGGFTVLEGAREALKQYDVVMAIGTSWLFGTIWYEPGPAFPEHTQFIHIDFDSWEIGKNLPIAVGIKADPRLAAAELLESVQKKMSPAARQAGQQRTRDLSAKKQANFERAQKRAEAEWDAKPISPWRLAAELRDAIKPHTVFVGGGGTSARAPISTLIDQTEPNSFFEGGAALGFPLPGALGVQLALPDRPVVGLLRDGDAMYSIQGLWTAAHYNIPVTYVVVNNAQYRILKLGMVHYLGESGRKSEFLGLDLNNPPLDFAKMCSVWGIPATRVENPKELGPALRDAINHNGPSLVDVVVDNAYHGYF